MTLKQAAKTLRISYRRALDAVHRGELGARMIKGQWDVQIPFTEQAIGVKAIAEMLDVSPRFIQVLCKRGRVRAIKLRKEWRVAVSDATKLIMARSQPPRSDQ